MTRELEAQYAALIATADDQPTVAELERQIRKDGRLENRARNALLIQGRARIRELWGL